MELLINIFKIVKISQRIALKQHQMSKQIYEIYIAKYMYFIFQNPLNTSSFFFWKICAQSAFVKKKIQKYICMYKCMLSFQNDNNTFVK